jgi:RTX calcium-binding nonapeptide repeat (4 copies)
VGNVTADNQADFQIQINGLHNLTADQIQGLASAVLTETSGNDALTGTSGNDILTGGGADDRLESGAGNGEAGNDSISDVVTENPDEGADRVNASADYTLLPDIESLVLVEGAGNISGPGDYINSVSLPPLPTTWSSPPLSTLSPELPISTWFMFTAGEANGDEVLDFTGNAALAGDSFFFVGAVLPNPGSDWLLV